MNLDALEKLSLIVKELDPKYLPQITSDGENGWCAMWLAGDFIVYITVEDNIELTASLDVSRAGKLIVYNETDPAEMQHWVNMWCLTLENKNV